LDNKEFKEDIFITVLGKSFYVIASGKITLVPLLAKINNILVHVKGGFVPVMLRQKEGKRRKAILVGTFNVLY
jgi:hypothetical protein